MVNSSRASSTRSKNRYRSKNSNANVDESLFGNTRAETNKNSRMATPLSNTEVLHFSSNKPISGSHDKTLKNSRKHKETVRVITKDLIRDVVVPSENHSNSIILNFSEYAKIAQKANDKTLDEAAIKKAQEQINTKKAEEARQRKAIMAEYDLKRKENEEVSELEAETRTIAAELIKRSQQKRLEENDEIKHLNELILEAKCHAIRDAQIAEKKQLLTEVLAEENRLDAMMEIDRVQGMQQQEEIVRKRKEQRQQGAIQIMNQIRANESERELEEERKDQEAKVLVAQQRKMQMDDLADIERKKNEQRKLQAEIDIINSEHQRMKEQKQEEERLADLRVIQYQKEKDAREAAKLEAEQKLKVEKELEIAKLRAAQERASDLQAERDALRAKRHEEATEREFRRKTREEAAKKKAIDHEMAIAREEQITNKRRLMAQQAARERAEFDFQLKIQQEVTKSNIEKDNARAQKQQVYSKEVREQIRERESQRINERKSFFEETINMDRDIEQKKQQLEEVKRKKLRDLKDSGVPEKYVSEVARRIGLCDI